MLIDFFLFIFPFATVGRDEGKWDGGEGEKKVCCAYQDARSEGLEGRVERRREKERIEGKRACTDVPMEQRSAQNEREKKKPP